MIKVHGPSAARERAPQLELVQPRRHRRQDRAQDLSQRNRSLERLRRQRPGIGLRPPQFSVEKKAIDADGVAYEAFPACPATDNEGPSAYGGDCYELVEESRDKTFSITYWIGPKSLHRSKSSAVKQARVILKSIVVK